MNILTIQLCTDCKPAGSNNDGYLSYKWNQTLQATVVGSGFQAAR